MDTQKPTNLPVTPNGEVYRRHGVIGLVAVVVAVSFFSVTNPTKLPAVLFIVAFMLVFVAMYGLVTMLVYIAALSGQLAKAERFRPRIKVIKLAIAAITTVLLGLSSIGQLTTKDVLTLIVFFGLLYFYVTRLARR